MQLKITDSQIKDFAKAYNLDYEQLCKISLEINKEDIMYEPNKDGSDLHYFSVGIQAFSIVKKSLEIAKKNNANNLLDFGCGFGRVLRFFSNQFVNTQITGCDIEAHFGDFCKQKFNANSFQSSVNLATLPTNTKYDVIWSGSVFTHLSKKNFKKLFEYFIDILSEGGIAVFTTHGRYCINNLTTHGYGLGGIRKRLTFYEYKLTNYGYQDYPNQKGYGISINTPAWLMEFVSGYPNVKIVGFYEKYWDNHQDVICIQKLGNNN